MDRMKIFICRDMSFAHPEFHIMFDGLEMSAKYRIMKILRNEVLLIGWFRLESYMLSMANCFRRIGVSARCIRYYQDQSPPLSIDDIKDYKIIVFCSNGFMTPKVSEALGDLLADYVSNYKGTLLLTPFVSSNSSEALNGRWALPQSFCPCKIEGQSSDQGPCELSVVTQSPIHHANHPFIRAIGGSKTLQRVKQVFYLSRGRPISDAVVLAHFKGTSLHFVSYIRRGNGIVAHVNAFMPAFDNYCSDGGWKPSDDGSYILERVFVGVSVAAASLIQK